MKNKTLFILGGSPLQVDLLRKAKERYHVIVIDGNANCALRNESDEFVHLDFSDTERLHELALTRKPSLILTMASEPGNLAAAIVSARLGLRYNPVEVVYATINKIRMKERLTAARIPTARYITVAADELKVHLEDGLTFPLVVKPSQSSAGRGVKLVNSTQDLETAVKGAKEVSKDGCALIEEFIAGNQYSIETISHEGQHTILGVTREHFGPPPFFAETQQMFPAEIAPDIEARIGSCVRDTLNALGIQHGACHVELRTTPEEKIYIIEIASRIGGWRSELIRKAAGIEYTDLLLQSHEEAPLSLEQKKNKYCLVKMIFSQADMVREQALRKDSSYIVSEITWLKDSIVDSQSSLMDSAGYYFVEANNLKDALNAL